MSIVDINGNELKGTMKDHLKVNKDNIEQAQRDIYALAKAGQGMEIQFSILVAAIEKLAQLGGQDFAKILEETLTKFKEAQEEDKKDE